MNDKTKKNNNDDLDDALNDEMFSADVMESCNKMLENLSKNPDLINKTVKNFMNTFTGLQEGIGNTMEQGSERSDELLTYVKRILARVIRLEKRLEKANVIKPSDE